MRIIGGQAKGVRLYLPKHKSVRPTLDRVKEALFNILAEKVPRSIFLDCYAGAGSIGLEALSRGAQKTYFVEKNAKTYALIKKNLLKTGLDAGAVVYRGDIEVVLKTRLNDIQFDLIYMDPPYNMPPDAVLATIIKQRALTDDGIMVLERSHKGVPLSVPTPVELFDKRIYGDVELNFYRLRS